MRLSEKLGALCAASALLPVILASALVLYQVSSYSQARASEQLQSNARAALGLYEKRLAELRSAAQALAEEIATKIVVSRENTEGDKSSAWARLQDLLPAAQNQFSLDFLIVTDPTGRVIARHNDRPAADETLIGTGSKNPIAERVIAEGTQLRNTPADSCVIESGERLAKLGLDLRARVKRASANASDQSEVEEALMLEAGAPIFSAGRFVGMVLFGQMLNNSYGSRPGASALQVPLESEVRQVLFRNSEREMGVVIALGDTIIASSVPIAGPTRETASKSALMGVRSRPEGTQEALAYAGNSYVASWQPIKSTDGTQVGAIGVVVPASDLVGPVAAIRNSLLAIGAVLAALSAVVGFFFGRALGRRIEALTEAANRMGVGELSRVVADPVEPAAPWLPGALSRDEITLLAEQLDQMRDSFRQAVERLRRR